MTAPSLAAPPAAGAQEEAGEGAMCSTSRLSGLPIVQFAGVGMVLGFVIVVELWDGRRASIRPS